MEKDGKRCGMNPTEILPAQVAGMAVKLIIGMSTPTLQPEVIFSLPSGLLVARVKLKDRYGSLHLLTPIFKIKSQHATLLSFTKIMMLTDGISRRSLDGMKGRWTGSLAHAPSPLFATSF